MAFNYGRKTLEIKNPFKTEGLLDLILGYSHYYWEYYLFFEYV
jgi:hypothetical protein